MKKKQVISAEQAYSFIKMMVQSGAQITVNDIVHRWEVVHENTNDEYLYMEDLFEGYNLQIFLNPNPSEEVRKEINNVSVITKAVVERDCLELSVTHGDDDMYIEFFPPKIKISNITF